MKKLFFNPIIIITTCLFFVSCQKKFKDPVEVIFSTELDQSDLDSIQESLKVLDINLVYNQVEFDSLGKLQSINTSIYYPDGSSGWFETGKLKPSHRPGFRRNLNKDKQELD